MAIALNKTGGFILLLHYYQITASHPLHSSRLTGMCGDCNGVPDDYRTADNRDVSGQSNKMARIAESYETGDQE